MLVFYATINKTKPTMKILNKIAPVALIVFTSIFSLSACESRRTIEGSEGMDIENTTTPDTDTIVVSRRNKEVARELNDFKNWVNNKANKVDSATNKNLPQVQAEFKKRTAHLEKGIDSLSADAKAEYQRAKVKYKEWEEQNKERTSQPLQAAQIKKYRKQLLGEYQNLNSIKGDNAREAYLVFMGMVRAKKKNWNQNDWDYVDYIYRQLNKRKGEIDASISSADNLKIRSLQAEYLALEAGHDAKDLINTVKN